MKDMMNEEKKMKNDITEAVPLDNQEFRDRMDRIVKALKDAGYDENKITVCESFMDAYNQASAVSGGQKIILIENDLPDNY